jgi:NADP-dependent aldehyde dehydrogenase
VSWGAQPVQFCTNPGLLFLPEGEDGDAFLAVAGNSIATASGQRMLSKGVAQAYVKGTSALRETAGVRHVAEGTAGDDPIAPLPC